MARSRSTLRRLTRQPEEFEGEFDHHHPLQRGHRLQHNRIRQGLVIATPTLTGLPALAVLEWIAVPVLGMASDGSIVFANWAFADMIGYTPEMVQGLTYRQIFGPTAESGTPMDVMRANAEATIELAHLDGSVVHARVSEPLLVGDEMALAMFHDMTEQLWLTEF